MLRGTIHILYLIIHPRPSFEIPSSKPDPVYRPYAFGSFTSNINLDAIPLPIRTPDRKSIRSRRKSTPGKSKSRRNSKATTCCTCDCSYANEHSIGEFGRLSGKSPLPMVLDRKTRKRSYASLGTPTATRRRQRPVPMTRSLDGVLLSSGSPRPRRLRKSVDSLRVRKSRSTLSHKSSIRLVPQIQDVPPVPPIPYLGPSLVDSFDLDLSPIFEDLHAYPSPAVQHPPDDDNDEMPSFMTSDVVPALILTFPTPVLSHSPVFPQQLETSITMSINSTLEPPRLLDHRLSFVESILPDLTTVPEPEMDNGKRRSWWRKSRIGDVDEFGARFPESVEKAEKSSRGRKSWWKRLSDITLVEDSPRSSWMDKKKTTTRTTITKLFGRARNATFPEGRRQMAAVC